MPTMLPTSPKQIPRVLSAADLERKYDLAAIAENKKAVKQSIEGLNATNSILEGFIAATLKDIENIQKQVDGNITTWFEKGEPALNTYPASEWTTEAELINHEGDMYYDKNTGYAYRFEFYNEEYTWEKIKDNDVVEALAIANAAMDTADGKKRVFIEPPTPPYDSGDLWFKNREIFICQVSKTSTEIYASNDFIVATKYTDDTYAKKVGDELVVLSGVVTTIKEGVDEWKVEVNSTFASVDRDITVAMTQIRANTDGINMKVDKNGVIGAINITEEVVKIAASRIELEGAVTFSALATDVSNRINTASTNASAAVTTANSASTAAASATATANSALSTANTANSNASTALATANTANTNATSALNRAIYHYGTCTTAAATAAKVVTLTGFALYTGAQVTVQFTYANTAANPTLNVNGTGAKNIRVNNANITSLYYWGANNTVTFVYNGTYWVMADTSANSIVAGWCSANDKTLIDGGKIYTDTLFSKDINITGKFTATADAYVAPGEYERNRLEQKILGNVSLTTAETTYYDLNSDGSANLKDLIIMQEIILGMSKYNVQSRAAKSSVTATIKPTAPEELIKLTATTPWGVTKTTLLGINGLECPKVIADGILAATIETASGANLDTINSNLGLKVIGDTSKEGILVCITITNQVFSNGVANADISHTIPTGYTLDNAICQLSDASSIIINSAKVASTGIVTMRAYKIADGSAYSGSTAGIIRVFAFCKQN